MRKGLKTLGKLAIFPIYLGRRRVSAAFQATAERVDRLDRKAFPARGLNRILTGFIMVNGRKLPFGSRDAAIP